MCMRRQCQDPRTLFLLPLREPPPPPQPWFPTRATCSMKSLRSVFASFRIPHSAGQRGLIVDGELHFAVTTATRRQPQAATSGRDVHSWGSGAGGGRSYRGRTTFFPRGRGKSGTPHPWPRPAWGMPRRTKKKNPSPQPHPTLSTWSISQVRHAATREWHQGLHTVSARSALRWVRGGG